MPLSQWKDDRTDAGLIALATGDVDGGPLMFSPRAASHEASGGSAFVVERSDVGTIVVPRQAGGTRRPTTRQGQWTPISGVGPPEDAGQRAARPEHAVGGKPSGTACLGVVCETEGAVKVGRRRERWRRGGAGVGTAREAVGVQIGQSAPSMAVDIGEEGQVGRRVKARPPGRGGRGGGMAVYGNGAGIEGDGEGRRRRGRGGRETDIG